MPCRCESFEFMKNHQNHLLTLIAIIAASITAPATRAQSRAPRVVSPEVSTNREVTFRIRAPKAEGVQLAGSDIPGAQPRAMTKGTNDVWELTVAPLQPGAYRYAFNVDGVSVVDPRNA